MREQPVALLALFVALGGSSYAATVSHGSKEASASANVVHGCVGNNTGRLRVVDSPIRCGSLETPISFNREGQRGPRGKTGMRGPQGPAGATGARGDTGPKGADGRDGAQGPKGDKGDTGPAGAEGLTALTATAAEPAGANCPTGGIRVDSGVDTNRDNQLDAGEVNAPATRYVCNGAQGPQGPTGMTGAQGLRGADGQSVVATTEPAGANCPNGGTKFTSASGDNYVCNGSAADMSAADFQAKLNAAAVDADTFSGLGVGAFVQGTQFDGLFSSRFDTTFPSAFDDRLGNLFGSSVNSSEMNPNRSDLHYIGEVFATAATFPPPGTAMASGQILPISQYPALFSLIGTRYGGDGHTTFALPDLRRQAPGGTNYVIAIDGLYPSQG